MASGQIELPERTTAQVELPLPNDPNHLKELLPVCGRVTTFDYVKTLKQDKIMAMNWNYEAYEKWADETHIPEDVMKMVDIVAGQLGIYVEETVVTYNNRFGEPYAYAKGFCLTHCTSSLADGPSADMTPVFMRWLGGLGFEVCNSYGDNGLDSATNWHDTYWAKEIAYKPSLVYAETFYYWDGDDEEDW